LIWSIVASTTCDFLSFENPSSGLVEPFATAVSGNVGIFYFSITKPPSNSCRRYEDKFGGMIESYESIAVAQICALIAAIFGMLGLFCILFEFFVCNFRGSFLFSSILFLLASGLQGGTFAIFGEKRFW